MNERHAGSVVEVVYPRDADCWSPDDHHSGGGSVFRGPQAPTLASSRSSSDDARRVRSAHDSPGRQRHPQRRHREEVTILVLWILAAVVYIVYAVLAVAQTSSATKTGVAMGFAASSIVIWMVLRHLHRKD